MEETRGKYQINAVRVCIDDYNDGMTGRAYSPLSKEEIPFTGIQELLLKVDQVFDEAGYPQAFQKHRTFWGIIHPKTTYQGIPKPVMDSRRILTQKGNAETYDILVKSRRNAGWQGTVHNEATNTHSDFRGELELLKHLLN